MNVLCYRARRCELYYVSTYTGLRTICSLLQETSLKKTGGGFDWGGYWYGGLLARGLMSGGGACVHGGICPGAIVRGGGACPGGIWPDTIDMANSNSTMIDEACV